MCRKFHLVSRNVAYFAALFFALAPPLSAQVRSGDTTLDLNGTVAVGYSDDFSNLSGSDHSLVGAGTADMVGSYFDPKFLSFEVQPYYNQSRVNSGFQSISASSGVNANAQIFSGSHYGGSVNYSTSYNSNGNFNVPGLANFTTHGDSETLGLNWGVHLEGLPSLSVNYANANNSYTIYGINSRGTLHSNVLSISTVYKVAGFDLNGGYQYSGSKSLTPEFLTGEAGQQVDTGVSSFSFGVGHALPGHGIFSAAASRLDLSTNLGGGSSTDRYDTTVDTYSGTVSFAPRAHLSVGASSFYTDNLEGTLFNSVLSSGAGVPLNTVSQSSRDFSATGYATYEIPQHHLNLHLYAERQQESFLGVSFASDSYNGTAMYSNRFLGGTFNGVGGLTYTSLVSSHQGQLGVNTSTNYTHQLNRWSFSGSFGYSQDTQTILIGYTSSGFNYSGSMGRRIRRKSYWGANVSGQKSLLTNLPDSANSSESYSSSFSLARFSVNGSYSSSRGNALLTSTGLVSTPVPIPVINPADLVFYNGNSYSVGASANPIHGLTLSAGYSKALSATQAFTGNSNNNNQNTNFLIIYNVRKISFISGYSRLLQGFSLSETQPTMVGSFYVGVSRWFNFF